jgi:hypothetical protein
MVREMKYCGKGMVSGGIGWGLGFRDEKVWTYSPVSSLSNILRVAELDHELVAGFRVLSQGKAFLSRAFGEAIVGQGKGDEVKGGCIDLLGLSESLVDFQCLDEATGPAVNEEEWNGILDTTPLMEEMDLEWLEAITLNGCPEMRMLVKELLGGSPVVCVSPVSGESLHDGQWCAIVPASSI